MKRIFITEKQKEKLMENIINDSSFIFDDEESLLSPYVIPHKLEKKLFLNRKNDLLEFNKKHFNFDLTNIEIIKTELSKIYREIQNIEKNNIDILEKLCFDLINEYLNLPLDLITVTCEIVDTINSDNTILHITPKNGEIEYDSSFEYDEYEQEIFVRSLMNMLITGASNVITKHLLKKYKGEINNINPSLYGLYRNFIWLNEYYLTLENEEITDENHRQIGGVKVSLNTNKQTLIKSNAKCLPVLIFETLKGIFELSISHGLPSDLKKAKYIIDQADLLKYEQYNIVMGTIIWNKIMSIISEKNIDNKLIPYFFTNISENTKDDISNILKEIILNTRKSEMLIIDEFNNIINDIDYEDFEARLAAKRSEKNIITDDEYMSEDELLDDKYFFNDIITGDHIDGCIEHNINKVIKEELSISMAVDSEASALMNQIIDKINQTKSVKSEKLPPDVSVKNCDMSYDFKNKKLLLSIICYNFKDNETYQKYQNYIDTTSKVNCNKERFVFGFIKCVSVCGTVIKTDLQNTLIHELNHIYQTCMGSTKIINKNYHYLSIFQNLNNKDEMIRKLAQSLYYSYDFEQDGFVNELYTTLMNHHQIVDWNVIKNTEIYNILHKMREMLKYVENNINDKKLNEILFNNFKLNTNRYIHRLTKGIKRLENKIGKVLIKHRKDKITNESIIKSIHENFPYIHNFDISDFLE